MITLAEAVELTYQWSPPAMAICLVSFLICYLLGNSQAATQWTVNIHRAAALFLAAAADFFMFFLLSLVFKAFVL